jgi:hypothetical protein
VDDPAEKRGGIKRIGKPISLEESESCPSDTVKEVLILVGGVKRGLGIGQTEEHSPEAYFGQAFQCAVIRTSHRGHGFYYAA